MSDKAAEETIGKKMANLSIPGVGCPIVSPRQLIRNPGEFESRRDSLQVGDSFRRENFILSFSGNLDDHYEMSTGQLGQGTYGSVKKGTNKATKAKRAVKTLAKSKLKSVGRFRMEISIMKSIDHPNIVKLFETFEDSKFIYLIMELCKGGELFDRIIASGNFKEEDARRIMKQVLNAVNYCHCKDIVHRDLKPENFLFLDATPDSDIKIIDFGLSKRASPDAILATKCGTPYYVSPQVLNSHYDSKCDCWSAGVIMYILLCGYPPFCGENDREILKKVKAGRYRYDENDWGMVSREARDLINQLLKFDPSQRISAQMALQHRWFKMEPATPQPLKGLPAPNSALGEKLLQNFRNFRAVGKLSKMALTIIAQHHTEDEIAGLRQIFFDIDKNGDGKLTVQELKDGFAKSGMGEISDLREILNDIDSDGSGEVDWTEFIAASMQIKESMLTGLCWQAFRILDADGSGTIGCSDLMQLMGVQSVQGVFASNHKAEIRRMIQEYDVNGDGVIDFEEFQEMVKKAENKPKL